jgi:hypothetical protein
MKRFDYSCFVPVGCGAISAGIPTVLFFFSPLFHAVIFGAVAFFLWALTITELMSLLRDLRP